MIILKNTKTFLNSSIILVLLFVSCKDKQEKTQPVFENITESVYASGIVKSINQYQVFSTVNGQIKKIFVTEGQLVEQGDPLIMVINETARLNAENAKLAEDFSSVDANEDKLKESKINIDLAKSKMSNDSLLLYRQRNLWSKNIGSENELEQRELMYQNSVTAYKSAMLRYNELKRQIDFSARQSENNRRMSLVTAGDYTIKSEVDGRVFSLLKKQGETVNMQAPVAVVGDANNFIMELQIDEYDISKIIKDQRILFSMDSHKGQVFEGRVKKIYPIMNERTRTFTIEANFISPPRDLYPNLTVEANIIIQTKEKVMTIPRSYLIDDSYVLTTDKEKKKVATGLKDYQKVEIISGLTSGETILKPLQ